MDLKDGFYHVSVSEESVKYTLFVTPLGQLEWLKMPFGLKTAPSTFQRCINTVLSDFLKTEDVVVYMDDIVVTTTSNHHLRVLERMLKVIVDNITEIRLDKCKFVQTKIEYLEYF